MHELVGGMIMLPWNRDLMAAYRLRDEMARASLAAGEDLKKRRYGVRMAAMVVEEKIAASKP